MAEQIQPTPVKLVVGAIFRRQDILNKARQGLSRKFGPVDFASPALNFDSTKHYTQEMGLGLKRQFFSFQKLINPGQLCRIKLFTNRLEKRFSRSKLKPSRLINLDPGYVSGAKLVLASCKNFSHRIYLDRGIYAEVTLNFHKFHQGTFKANPWTYPDYGSKHYIQHLNTIRAIYLKQLT